MGHYTPMENTAMKDQEDFIRKLKRKVRRDPDDAVDASDATSEDEEDEEDEEEKAGRKARTRKKRCLRKEKADVEKGNQAQLLLELVHYQQAEEQRRLA